MSQDLGELAGLDCGLPCARNALCASFLRRAVEAHDLAVPLALFSLSLAFPMWLSIHRRTLLPS